MKNIYIVHNFNRGFNVAANIFKINNFNFAKIIRTRQNFSIKNRWRSSLPLNFRYISY